MKATETAKILSDRMPTPQSNAAQRSVDRVARIFGQKIIERHACEALWPSERNYALARLLRKLNAELADAYSKNSETAEPQQMEIARSRIIELCQAAGMEHIRLKPDRRILPAADNIPDALILASTAYSLGNLFFERFFALFPQNGIQAANIPLARSVGVWLAGQALLELYLDPWKLNTEKDTPSDSLNPVFDSLNLDQLRELALQMGIDPRVSWTESRIRQNIVTEVTGFGQQNVRQIKVSAPKYKTILLSVCEEVIPEKFAPQDAERQLEDRILETVLQRRELTLAKISQSAPSANGIHADPSESDLTRPAKEISKKTLSLVLFLASTRKALAIECSKDFPAGEKVARFFLRLLKINIPKKFASSLKKFAETARRTKFNR
jgi:hypothetical protein